jgi:hypothetical protein
MTRQQRVRRFTGRSRFKMEAERSSWPLPATVSLDALAEHAIAEGVLCEQPTRPT